MRCLTRRCHAGVVGGTPVITSDRAAIAVHDWRFLDLWDADIIYSYVPLSDVLRDRIAYSLAPGVIKTHPVVEYPLDSYFFRPSSTMSARRFRRFPFSLEWLGCRRYGVKRHSKFSTEIPPPKCREICVRALVFSVIRGRGAWRRWSRHELADEFR